MIMAGRGRRLGDGVNSIKNVGITPSSISSHNEPDDIESLSKNIEAIDLDNVDPKLIQTIETSLKNICSNKKALKNVLSSLYSKALSNNNCLEKLAIAILEIIHIEIDETTVKREFLTIMQEEYETRHSVIKLNKPRLHSAIEFLGRFYYLSNLYKSSLWILGKALIDYLELLLTGNKEEIMLFTKQIALNHNQLSNTSHISENYNYLEIKLRNLILCSTLPEEYKCWLLLAIEIMKSDPKPLSTAAKDFYTKYLNNDFVKLESFISKMTKLNAKQNALPNTTNKGAKKKAETSDLSLKFIDINISASENDKGRKGKGSFEPNKTRRKENHNLHGNKKFFSDKKDGFTKSEHDDRFDKNKNY